MTHGRVIALVVVCAAMPLGCSSLTWFDPPSEPSAAHPPAPASANGAVAIEIPDTAASGEPQPPNALEQRIQTHLAKMPQDDLAARLARRGQSPKPTPDVSGNAQEPSPQPSVPDATANTAVPAVASAAPSEAPVRSAAMAAAPSPPTAGGAPVVLAVEVRAADKSAGPAEPVAGPEQSVCVPLQLPSGAPDRATDLRTTIAQLERELDESPNDFDRQLRLRLLYLANDRPAKATEAWPNADADMQQRVLGLVRVVAAARGLAGHDPARKAGTILTALEDYRRQLRERADLRIPRVAICRRVASFGVFDPITPADFPAGRQHTVILYCEVDNFRSDPQPDGRYLTRLAQRIEVFTSGGEPVFSRKETLIEDRSRNRREDFFLAQKLLLPATLNPGEYVLKVTLTDTLAEKISQNTTSFRVTAG